MFSDIIKSTIDSLKNRLTNPIYGTFIVVWILTNWKFVYSFLFLSQTQVLEKTSLLKNNYLYLIFSQGTYWHHFIIPSAMTILVIWVLPKLIFIPAFKKEESYRIEKEKIRILLNKELEDENIENIKTLSKRIREENKLFPLWENNYKKFKETPIHKDFHFIVDSIYKHNGYVSRQIPFMVNNRIIPGRTNGLFKIPDDILVYADSNGLINFDKQKNIIELTDKGKYFVQRFSTEEKQNIQIL